MDENPLREYHLVRRRHRSFYEDLPDLLSTVPPSLLGLTEEQAEQLREEERARQREATTEAAAVGGEAQEGDAEARRVRKRQF